MKLRLTDIKPNPDNPRLIKDEKYQKLVQSLKDFPEMADVREIVVNKDHVILGGNMRYNAMKEAGWSEAPVKVVDWPEDKQKEFIIKDNVGFGEWEWDVLANQYELEDLDAWGVDLPDALMADEEVLEDEAPEVEEGGAASSVLGAVYQLGRHRVMCGDSTLSENMETLFGETKFDLYLSDPPYNVDYEGKTKDKLKIENDKKDDVEFRSFLTDAFLCADTRMKSGASFYILHADSEGFNFRAAVKDAGWAVRQCLIWIKNSMVMGRQDYQWQHEPILYGWKEGASHNWFSDRRQTTLLSFERPTKSTEHPTMKPLNLLAYLIGNSSKSEDIVFDNFLGSGSTLMACQQKDRTCYGMELDPKYVDVIRKRYAKYVSPDTWETEWEALTPPIQGNNKENNGES